MNWLAIILAFQIGTSDKGIYSYSTNINYFESPDNSFYIKIDTGIDLFNFITIRGFMKSYQIYHQDIYFNPYQIDYGFTSNIKIKNITFGFTHECDHPLYSNFCIVNRIHCYNTELYLQYELKINP